MREFKSLNPAGLPDLFHAEILGEELIVIETFGITTLSMKNK